MIESAARRLASELVDRRESINRELSRNGVRFGIYKNGEYHDRLFPYDPIPRIIESNEFDRMEAGLKQRVNALNAYLRDIYSDKQAIKDGIVPEEYVYTSAGYFPQVNGVTPPGGVFAHIAGEDLVQGQDGQWWVLEDNLRIPSGASYPLFARDIERRITPSLFRNVRVRDNRDYPRLLRQSMDFVSTDGIAVVLTPGRYNSAFFEHAYLAEKTGAALAFPEDLEVVDNKVYFLDYAGRKHRVGVVYRRLSDEYLDPFAFNPDSVVGVPGILSAYRSGNVAIVNAPGNGAADDKAIYYFVPNMIRYYLGEEPILHNAPTYMPMFDKDRKEVLDRLGELVIKDVAEAGGYGVVFGSSLDRLRREELAERIKAEPRRFIAQEVIQFKDIDVVDPETGQMSPRKCDLRAFVVTGKNTHVWYSGLTRYSSIPGQMIVNSSQGGGFKDTWVLAKETGVEHDYAPGSEVVRVLEQSRKHSLALVTASKADNLFWLGRYTERVFTTLSQFFPFYGPCDGHGCGRVPTVRPRARPAGGFRGFRRVHPQLPVRREESGFRTQRHRLRVQQRGDSAPRTWFSLVAAGGVGHELHSGGIRIRRHGRGHLQTPRHRGQHARLLGRCGEFPRRTDSEIVHFRGQISGTSGSVHTIRIFRGRAQGAARQTGQLHPAVERSAGTAMLRRRIALAGRPAAAAGICGACGKTGDAAERFRWAHLHEGSEGSGHAQHDGHGRRATVKNTCHSHRTVRV